MGKNEGNVRSIGLQNLEEWINDQEDLGTMLNDLGVISDEEYAAGIHKLEDFRVKIETDTVAEAEAETKLEAGEAPVTV